MAGVKDYSTTPASNTALFPEGMAPSSVNDSARQMQADIRAEVATKGTDIASASSIDLGAATGDFVDVTGTTTITALGTVSAGIRRTVRFTGALTLTHNATSLILPGGANITTADGDVARFRSLGSGNWVCEFYSKADGTALDTSALAKLDASNVFSANQTVRKTSGGATQILHADHATAGTLAGTNYNQDNSAGDETIMAQIEVVSSDLTDGSEDALMRLRTIIAGTLATRLNLGAGLWTDGATGGDPGADGINASTYQQDGREIAGATAWVNFTGTGTVGINDSLNVLSVTDNGTGDYTVNFETAMANADYSYTGMIQESATSAFGNSIHAKAGGIHTTSALQIVVKSGNGSTTFDHPQVCVHFFGGI